MTDRMDILSTRSYTTRDGEQKTAFTRIGTAWANKNGNGWSLTFEALPLPTLNDKGQVETRALMMPPKQDGAQSSGPPAGGRRAPAYGDDSDGPPF
jgi:hypothetical protein